MLIGIGKFENDIYCRGIRKVIVNVV